MREAVLGVPGVADLNGGVLQEISTYLPGKSVPGVRVTEDGVHVHIVIEASAVEYIPALAGAVHQTAARAVHEAAQVDSFEESDRDVHVHVHIDDVAEGFADNEKYSEPGTKEDES